jgi:DNA-binding NarL/FixJ family response regulator
MHNGGGNGHDPYENTAKIRLSERQAQIIVLIAKGEPNRIIAEKLDLSVHTVDAYCRRIYRKFDTASRVTAAVRAAQSQLLPPI